MISVAELGKRTKAKYPQYKDMSDAEVGRRVLEKYPEYSSEVKTPGVLEKGGALDNISNLFLGRAKDFGTTLDSAGRALGAEAMMGEQKAATWLSNLLGGNKTLDSFANTAASNANRLAQTSADIRQEQGTTGNIDTGNPLETAGNVAKRDVGAYGELASYLIPGGQLGNATGAQRVGSAALQGAEIGALRGVTNPDDMTPEERLVRTLEEAGLGGILGSATQGLFEGARVLTSKAKDVANNLWGATLKENKTADKILSKWGGVEGFKKKAIEYQIPASKDKVAKEINEMGKSWGQNVNDVIAQSDDTVNIPSLIEKAKADLQKYNNPVQKTKYQAAIKELDRLAKEYGDMSLSDAYSLRKLLDSEGARNFLKDGTRTQGKKIGMSRLATVINEEIKRMVPEVTPEFTRYSLLKDALAIYYKEPAFGITNLVATAIGAPFGVPAALGTTAVGFSLKSPAVKRTVGNVLSKVPEVAPQSSKILPGYMNPLMRYVETQMR